MVYLLIKQILYSLDLVIVGNRNVQLNNNKINHKMYNNFNLGNLYIYLFKFQVVCCMVIICK